MPQVLIEFCREGKEPNDTNHWKWLHEQYFHAKPSIQAIFIVTRVYTLCNCPLPCAFKHRLQVVTSVYLAYNTKNWTFHLWSNVCVVFWNDYGYVCATFHKFSAWWLFMFYMKQNTEQRWLDMCCDYFFCKIIFSLDILFSVQLKALVVLHLLFTLSGKLIINFQSNITWWQITIK